jgi:hypothetical protein
MNDNWGLCKACRWWQLEPEALPRAGTVGFCSEESRLPMLLSVTGTCGCSLFDEGKPGRLKGASEHPPYPQPLRV